MGGYLPMFPIDAISWRNVHIGLPPVGRSRPRRWHVNGGLCLCRRLGHCQGRSQRCHLGGTIAGFSEGVSQRKVGEDETGYPDLFDNVAGGTDNHGDKPGGFKNLGGQTDRLMTDRSKPGEDNPVNTIVAQESGELLGILGGATMAIEGWYRVVVGTDGRDFTAIRELR